jgi:hypothetical protein
MGDARWSGDVDSGRWHDSYIYGMVRSDWELAASTANKVPGSGPSGCRAETHSI